MNKLLPWIYPGLVLVAIIFYSTKDAFDANRYVGQPEKAQQSNIEPRKNKDVEKLSERVKSSKSSELKLIAQTNGISVYHITQTLEGLGGLHVSDIYFTSTGDISVSQY